jgi:hypothetical protein
MRFFPAHLDDHRRTADDLEFNLLAVPLRKFLTLIRPLELPIDFNPVLSYTIGNITGNVTDIVVGVTIPYPGRNFNQVDSEWQISGMLQNEQVLHLLQFPGVSIIRDTAARKRTTAWKLQSPT